MSAEEKLAFYAQQFDEAFGLAEAVQSYVGGSVVDLEEEGLGTIEIETNTTSSEEMTEMGYGEGMGYRGLRVYATAFDPQIEGILVYTHPESLEDNSQHIQAEAQHPRHWEYAEGWIHLHENGQVDESGGLKHLDEAILCVLDARETLGVVVESLHREPSGAVQALGQTAAGNS